MHQNWKITSQSILILFTKKYSLKELDLSIFSWLICNHFFMLNCGRIMSVEVFSDTQKHRRAQTRAHSWDRSNIRKIVRIDADKLNFFVKEH